MKRQNWLLLLGVVVLSAGPLLWIRPQAGQEEVFVGADHQAGQVIAATRPDYAPWFAPLWEPPSKEIESLLFGLQAALGAAAIGYCLGYYRGRRRSPPKAINRDRRKSPWGSRTGEVPRDR